MDDQNNAVSAPSGRRAIGQAIVVGRTKAIRLYTVLGLVQLLLGLVLMTSAGVAVHYTADSKKTGPPYYVGAFMSGITVLCGAVVAFIIRYTGGKIAESEEVKRKVNQAIRINQVLGIVTLIVSFIGLVLVGLGGLCNDGTCYYDSNVAQNEAIGVVIVVLLIITIATVLYMPYVACAYGPFFGVLPEMRPSVAPAVVVVVSDQSGGDPELFGITKDYRGRFTAKRDTSVEQPNSTEGSPIFSITNRRASMPSTNGYVSSYLERRLSIPIDIRASDVKTQYAEQLRNQMLQLRLEQQTEENEDTETEDEEKEEVETDEDEEEYEEEEAGEEEEEAEECEERRRGSGEENAVHLQENNVYQ